MANETNTPAARTLMADVLAYFEARDLSYFKARPTQVMTGFGGADGEVRVAVRVSADGRVATAVATMGHAAPPDRRAATATLMNALNHGRLSVGNLEMDPDDGEVTYRQSALASTGRLADADVDALLSVAVQTLRAAAAEIAATIAGAGGPTATRRIRLDAPENPDLN